MRPKMDGEWLSLRQARILSGRDAHTIMKLALCGEIRHRVPPASTPQFNRDDLERFSEREAVRAAAATV